ncbi:hypothetical protein OROGR_026802 [Orobanche gracilis]
MSFKLNNFPSVLTLLFNSYCLRRFLLTFKGFSVERIKDRLDHNDPSISPLYEKLATAYQDPAMEPVRYSAASESSTTPLLHGYS